MNLYYYQIGYSGCDYGDHAIFISTEKFTSNQLKQIILKACKMISNKIRKQIKIKVYRKEPILFTDIFINHFELFKSELAKSGLNYKEPITKVIIPEGENIGTGGIKEKQKWFEEVFTPFTRKQKRIEEVYREILQKRYPNVVVRTTYDNNYDTLVVEVHNVPKEKGRDFAKYVLYQLPKICKRRKVPYLPITEFTEQSRKENYQ